MIHHRDKKVVFMQHLVVLEVVQHGIGHGARLGGQKDCRAFYAPRRVDEHGVKKAFEINGIVTQLFIKNEPPFFPGHHQRKNGACNQDWEPATFDKFEGVGGQEGKVN